MKSKLKRSFAAVLAAAAISVSAVGNIPAYALTENYIPCVVYDYDVGGYRDLYDVIEKGIYTYNAESRFEVTLKANENGQLPTILDKATLNLIKARNAVIVFKITDPDFNIEYQVTVSHQNLKEEDAVIPDKGINIALKFTSDPYQNRLYVYTCQPGIGSLQFSCRINYKEWNLLAVAAGLHSDAAVLAPGGVYCFINDDAETFIKQISFGEDANFAMLDQGIFFAKMERNNET